jgi:hypothetical protein
MQGLQLISFDRMAGWKQEWHGLCINDTPLATTPRGTLSIYGSLA